MKKFIINILIFSGIVAVIDVAAGKVFWYLQSTKAGGGTGSEYYVCKEGTEDNSLWAQVVLLITMWQNRLRTV